MHTAAGDDFTATPGLGIEDATTDNVTAKLIALGLQLDLMYSLVTMIQIML